MILNLNFSTYSSPPDIQRRIKVRHGSGKSIATCLFLSGSVNWDAEHVDLLTCDGAISQRGPPC